MPLANAADTKRHPGTTQEQVVGVEVDRYERLASRLAPRACPREVPLDPPGISRIKLQFQLDFARCRHEVSHAVWIIHRVPPIRSLPGAVAGNTYSKEDRQALLRAQARCAIRARSVTRSLGCSTMRTHASSPDLFSKDMVPIINRCQREASKPLNSQCD